MFSRQEVEDGTVATLCMNTLGDGADVANERTVQRRRIKIELSNTIVGVVTVIAAGRATT